ncbi:MAG: nucleoside deaminase [Acidobacteriota bacterium]|nr:nucleoside deaminase [Acidobacteriota bacterium]
MSEFTTHGAYIRRCIALAQQARQRGDEPFAAVLVVDDDIVLMASNRVVSDADPTRHAELILASEACRRFDRDTRARAILYTSTEPCVMCCGAIYWSRIPRVVFGCSAASLGEITGGSLVVPSRTVFAHGRRGVEVVGPVLGDEALAVHRGFWD